MVSKFDHCLNDLLYRWRTKTLDADLAASKADAEATLLSLVEEYKVGGTRDQHPPLVPAKLRRCQALPPAHRRGSDSSDSSCACCCMTVARG